MHPRNKHNGRYPIEELLKVEPGLAAHVVKNPRGEPTINFDDPRAVVSLNTALLKFYYGLRSWKIPTNFLCPPIPGRADYIHHLSDLFPEASNLRGLDVGVGANAIYPLIGNKTYDWSFVGSDANPQALSAAQENIESNALQDMIELRLQKNNKHIFKGIILDGESYDFTMCNPPFHASAKEAQAGSERKKRNLGLRTDALNFGGQSQELWCEGGERSFLLTMISESQLFKSQVKWFTSLVSREANLALFQKAIRDLHCKESRVIEMSQGQKKSRILAWSFL
jgi:23S rRNA (adenine1618-N6)-methyltransferase